MGIRFQVSVTGTDLNRLAWLLARAGLRTSLTDPSSDQLLAFVIADSPEIAHDRVEIVLKGEQVRIGPATPM